MVPDGGHGQDQNMQNDQLTFEYSQDQDVSTPKLGSRRRDDEPSRETSSNTDPLRPTQTDDHDIAHKSKRSKVGQAQVAQTPEESQT